MVRLAECRTGTGKLWENGLAGRVRDWWDMVGAGSARENLREKGEVGSASLRIGVVWVGEVKRWEKAGHDGNCWVMD